MLLKHQRERLSRRSFIQAMRSRASLLLVSLADGVALRLDARADDLTFTSKSSGTHLLELFTSEGMQQLSTGGSVVGNTEEQRPALAGFRPDRVSRRLLGSLGMERSFCAAPVDAASARLRQSMGQFFGLHTRLRSRWTRMAELVGETFISNTGECRA